MSAPSEDPRELLRAASAWLEEWIEEGVEEIPALAADAPQDEAPSRPEPPAPRPAVAVTPARSPGESAAPAPSPTETAAVQTDLVGVDFGDPPTLEGVRQVLGECTRCGLCEGRSTIVFGDGNPEADLLFVGEGPGENEDRQGLPFVGRAGELLTAMIEKGLGISRADVYICNIVKCRPPGNRTPLPGEVNACRPFLDGQIDAIRPRAIVSLGKPATSLLLGRDVAISRVRGTWHDYRGFPVMPTFHPAFILRQYTEQNRRLVWEDLKAALERSRQVS